VGLERAEAYRAAEATYRAATRRWPDRLGGWVGLANARYQVGDLEGAAGALRAGTERHPDAPQAWNNLAVILDDMGRRQEAVRAARKAVRLAGEQAGAYRQTLQEIGAPAQSGAQTSH
jgi:predicted Zn-dependent protease